MQMQVDAQLRSEERERALIAEQRRTAREALSSMVASCASSTGRLVCRVRLPKQ
jgi:hypothetical protein